MSKNNDCITDQVVQAIQESGISVRKIAKKAGVAASTIFGWLNREKTPRVESCQWVLIALGKKLKITENSDNGE